MAVALVDLQSGDRRFADSAYSLLNSVKLQKGVISLVVIKINLIYVLYRKGATY
jgi:hypothetical protein